MSSTSPASDSKKRKVDESSEKRKDKAKEREREREKESERETEGEGSDDEKGEEPGEGVSSFQTNDEGEKYLPLSSKRRVTLRYWQGKQLIDIREYYEDKKSGEMRPGSKGISLAPDQFEELIKAAPQIRSFISKGK
jgi:hypothetical protein